MSRTWWKWVIYAGSIAALIVSASFTIYCAWKVYAYHQPGEGAAAEAEKMRFILSSFLKNWITIIGV